MPSVTRDRKKYGAPTVYTEAERAKERQRLREMEIAFYRELDPRLAGDYYHAGRLNPLIEDE
jgi:hypothetical protein